MISTVTLAAVAAGLSVLSFDIYMFAAASFLIHFALIGFLGASVVYFSEITDDNYRLVGPCFFYVFWGLGHMVFSFMVSYVTASWTSIMIYLIAIPLIVSAFYLRNLQESPRYCVVQHRFKEAKDAIMTMARMNNSIMSDFSIEEEIKLTQSSQAFSAVLEENPKPPERKFNYHMLTLFKYLSLKKPSFVILYFTSLLTILFYNTPLSIDNLVVNPYTNLFIMGLIQLFAALFAANATLNYRRKSCFRVIFIVIGVSYLYFALFHIDIEDPDTHMAHLSVHAIFVILSKMAVTAGMAMFTVYICEVYPTVIRHFATGFYNTLTKLAVVLTAHYVSFMNAVFIGPLLPISLAAFATLYIMTHIPETKDKHLEDYIEEEKPLLYDRVDRELPNLFK